MKQAMLVVVQLVAIAVLLRRGNLNQNEQKGATLFQNCVLSSLQMSTTKVFIVTICDSQNVPCSRFRGAAETIVVARGDDAAATATTLGFAFDAGIMCADLMLAFCCVGNA